MPGLKLGLGTGLVEAPMSASCSTTHGSMTPQSWIYKYDCRMGHREKTVYIIQLLKFRSMQA